MSAISYTFPNDFRHESLRGLTASGGKAVVRGGASVGSDWNVAYREPELGIEFTSGPEGKPFSIGVSRYPDLQALAREQVLSDFAISETHGIKRTSDQLGKIVPGNGDVRCSVRCADQSEAKGMDYSQVFAIVKHPEYGYVGVTRLEFAALGLQEVASWDFLERV